MSQLKTKPEKDISSEVKFEILLLEISTLFINLPIQQIDGEITAAQQHICDFLDLDRSSLWLAPEENAETMQLSHICQPNGSLPANLKMGINDFFQYTCSQKG